MDSTDLFRPPQENGNSLPSDLTRRHDALRPLPVRNSGRTRSPEAGPVPGWKQISRKDAEKRKGRKELS